MTKDRYNEINWEVINQQDLFLKIIKDDKLIPDEHLDKFNRVHCPEYKEDHILSLLCYSWMTIGCCDINKASITKASTLACPSFNGFCIYVDFHPFSMDYLGLDALTKHRGKSDTIIGSYHSMVIETILTYADIVSTSNKTNAKDF